MGSDAPIRVLIADDSSPVRRQLRRLIESQLQGAMVEEAENGREAIERVVEACPDIAVLDVAMPELNGLMATERISAIAPHLPVVVHTMYATPQIETKVKKPGARAVVAKEDGRALLSVIAHLAGLEQFA